ncbi:MAG: glycosyltransferase [Candidatus Aphodosoma sp.]
MRILQVNVLASAGSTGKITTDIHHTLLSKGYESLVCYGAGADVPEEKGYYRICSEFERHVNTFIRRCHGIAYGYYASLSTRRLINKIREYKPDVVHLQCINAEIVDIYKLLKFLGDKHIKTVCTLHAEFMHTGTCGHSYDCLKFSILQGCNNCKQVKYLNYFPIDNSNRSWKLMKEAFSHFRKDDIIFTSVSPWLMKRAMMSPIVNSYIHTVVLNGINQNIFRIRELSDNINKKFPTNKKLLLFVSANFNQDPDNIKGGYFFIELAKRMPQYTFCVVASLSSDIDNLPENVIFWGRTNGQEELAELYNRADLTVLTSKRETFSMIVAESLCCGTPIVGFEAGGPESIAIDKYSKFVKHGDIDALQNAAEEFLNKELDFKQISHDAHVKYSKEVMTESFIRVYKKLLEKQ